jgi:hypothetical protein
LQQRQRPRRSGPQLSAGVSETEGDHRECGGWRPVSKKKLRVAKTDTGHLVSNLRGEVGEVVTTWLLLRQLMAESSRLSSGEPARDLENRQLSFLRLLSDRLGDERVARLSELAEEKIGRLTFHFAAQKLGRFRDEVAAFGAYVVRHGLRDKRNNDVSHKVLPETWSDHRQLYIPYPVLLRATALAIRLMKRIDRQVLGPSAPYLWREARKRRYQFMSPPRVGYMLLPYLRLSGRERIQVVHEEAQEGTAPWVRVPTTVDGHPADVLANKKWGVLLLGDRLVALNEYPLQQLGSIETNVAPRPQEEQGAAEQPEAADEALPGPGSAVEPRN